MATALEAPQVRLMVLRTADNIIAAEQMLSQADRDLGDGDHGLGMKRGMEAVKAKLDGMEPASVEEVFVTTGTAMMSSMGGASGALFGTIFRGGGKALAGRPSFDAEGLALFLEAALEGVMKRGGAKPGDKTMIDAIDPAFAPGVSHYEPGGFSSRDVISILQNINGNVVGADLVEFNPTRDSSGITAMLAAKLYKEIVDVLLTDVTQNKK